MSNKTNGTWKQDKQHFLCKIYPVKLIYIEKNINLAVLILLKL